MHSSLALIDRADNARAVLDPVRLRILSHLTEPDSAANVARALDMPRQRVGYHVRELEKRGLLRTVGRRRKGNTVERLVQATARHYLIVPQVLGPLSVDPDTVRDRFSSTYLVAVAARTIREVSTLRRKATEAEKKLATFTAHHDVRLSSPRALHDYARELTELVAQLNRKYHDPDGAPGRSFRFVVQGYPAPSDSSGAEEVSSNVNTENHTRGEVQ